MNVNAMYRVALSLLWPASVVALCLLPAQKEFDQIALFGIPAFISYFLIIWKPQIMPIRWLVVMAVGVRLLIIPSLPLLSDDIYRFIWDGRLWHLGYNPFSHLPTHWLEQGVMSQDLFALLNSPEYYTIYPPVPQVIFYLSTIVSSNELWTEALLMKSIHCAFELGTLRVLWLLLKSYKLPLERWALYALNPLIILEVLGNVHHEGIMIFFIFLSLLLLHKQNYYAGGISMALAIATKLLPLLLCPFLFFYLKGKVRWKFTLATLGTSLILFGPLLMSVNVAGNLIESADLYVRSFEFNASIYYLLRRIGQWIYGYNIIGTLGPILKGLTVLIIFYIALRTKKNRLTLGLPSFLLCTYLVFVAFSSTVHPWYILLLVGLSPLTSFRFPIVWSFLILGTYINYSFNPYEEQIWVVIIEYSIVALLAYKELQRFLQNEEGPLPIFGK